MLKWKEEYSIGVAVIDEQHMRLFEIGNQIYDLLENYLLPDKYDKIVTIILELKDYTIYHFKTEEDYMLKIKYPGYFKQKVAHDDFIKEIESIDLDAIDQDQDGHTRKLLNFIFDWVLDHILKSDFGIKEFIRITR
ncbi:hemerythrin-like metal-binding domain-containing protein [Desulfitobacterium dichloroeliminans LMG P-21439]|uniref:Hemerythrin-like metal-binding domain-containing protein n=1 Tax=Desulfitobacterium dichloroeliminans (strain LMG P-21439 / DCA1) TaxID=871963 RepID=L0F448_DESDL|nr:hemerythrin family protein [Desulfitobacterium dichloroeliminans]AGA67708.1 hemerythrin-like metal-binding domain-containing protein [Desulfitobacterium dichloroeliminans LMG P-21439]